MSEKLFLLWQSLQTSKKRKVWMWKEKWYTMWQLCLTSKVKCAKSMSCLPAGQEASEWTKQRVHCTPQAYTQKSSESKHITGATKACLLWNLFKHFFFTVSLFSEVPFFMLLPLPWNLEHHSSHLWNKAFQKAGVESDKPPWENWKPSPSLAFHCPLVDICYYVMESQQFWIRLCGLSSIFLLLRC